MELKVIQIEKQVCISAWVGTNPTDLRPSTLPWFWYPRKTEQYQPYVQVYNWVLETQLDTRIYAINW